MKTLIGISVGLLVFAAAHAAQIPSSNDVPTFNKDVAPIVYQNCVICHRPGEVAPFSLLTYQDAAKRAKLIATVTERRYMPPWKAEHGYGEFANERRITDLQIATIRAWSDGGAPEGDSVKPQPPVFADGWLGGQPDKVLMFPSKYALAADGPDRFQCFVLPLNLDQDTYVSGVEFRPENRRVVHHALVFLDPSNNGRSRASKDGSYPCFGGPGFPGAALIGGWAPGSVPLANTEPGMRPVPKGSDLVVQIHYHPSGKPEMDQSSLGLKFSDRPGTKGRTAVILFNRRINIAPGDPHYMVTSSIVMPRDVELSGIAPHAHYLGKEMKITAQLPDGSEKPLIWIKDWDFNWQGAYQYVKPISLPKGTRVSLEYVYDNSAGNPRNPANPPVRVRWGEQTTDEMAIAFLAVTLPPAEVAGFQQDIIAQYVEQIFAQGATLDDLPPELSPQQRQSLIVAFNLFDANHDGNLDSTESAAIIQFLRLRR